MKFNKILALILAMLCILSVVLVSCSENNESTTDSETEADAAETSLVPGLPKYNGGGADFNIVYTAGYSNEYQERYIEVEDPNADAVSEAVWKRNELCSSELNIKINGEVNESVGQYLIKEITAGTCNVSLISELGKELDTLVEMGYLYNLNDLKYANFDSDYWATNATEQLSVCNKLFFTSNDISMCGVEGARFFYFNKTIAENYNLGDLYQYVYDDQWTLDTCFGVIKSVSDDMDGDGWIDSNDVFGMLTENTDNNSAFIYFFTGSGLTETEKDDEGNLEYSFNDEKTVNLIDKCRDTLFDDRYCIDYYAAAAGVDTESISVWRYGRQNVFGGDHCLFIQDSFGDINQLTDMESDFGILPTPKYDENQEEYYHRVDRFTPLLAIPYSVSNIDDVDLIVEYMAYRSHELLWPTYYEMNLKVKKARDITNDSYMIDIIKDSLSFEIAYIFNTGSSAMLYRAYQDGNFKSTYESSISEAQEKLDAVMDLYL